MEAKELRIGNYVRSPKGARYDGYDIQWSMNEFYWITECVIDIESFHPIPLTEEWLIKFGFDNEEFDYYGIDETVFRFYFTYKGLSDSKHNNCYLCNGVEQMGENIKHVHQLQNLYFALTNKELNIK